MRKRRGLTHADVVKALGLSKGSRTVVYLWEAGTREPRASTILRLAKVLDVAPGYLLGTRRARR